MVTARVRMIACALCRAAPAALLAGSFCLGMAAAIRATEPATFFRIGTGGKAGTYFTIGQALADVLREEFAVAGCPAPPCPESAPLPVAQLSSGSVANLRDLEAGRLEAALVQADVARWAYAGAGPFEGQPPKRRLRAVASLYPESLHIVTLRRSGIRRIAELRGRRISVDEWGSGTLPLARRVLAAHGLREGDFEAHYIKPGLAVEQLAAGKLDAFLIVGGYPLESVVRLADIAEVHLLPVEAERLEPGGDEPSLIAPARIPAGTYEGVAETNTVAVAAQLLVRADLAADLVHRLTARLWRDDTRARLAAAHPQGAEIRPEEALRDLSVPLHPGAERYYREAALLE